MNDSEFPWGLVFEKYLEVENKVNTILKVIKFHLLSKWDIQTHPNATHF